MYLEFHFNTHVYSLSLTHTLYLSLSHTHTHTLSLSLSHTHTHTLYLSLSHTHTHTLSLSFTHTHTHSLSLSFTHTHTHTHTHSHSLTPPPQHCLRLLCLSLPPCPTPLLPTTMARSQWTRKSTQSIILNLIAARLVRCILPCSTNMTSLHGCAYCVAEQSSEAHTIRCQLVLRVVVFCVGGALIHGGHQLEMNMFMFAFQSGTPWLR